MLTSNFQATIGKGGYAYAFSDATATPPGGSSACIESTAFCGKGTSVMQNTADYSDPYGGGIGINLNEAMGASSPGTYTPTGSGVAYTLTSLPTGARIIIGNGTTDYCFTLTSATGTVPWASFNTMCYATPIPAADALTGPPVGATHIEFEIPSAMTASSWDFCVSALGFAP
jgi:hypothetical protein